MSHIKLEEPLLSKFRACQRHVALQDAAGNLVGYFLPAVALEPSREPTISEEEMDERERRGGARPLGDFLTRLERGE